MSDTAVFLKISSCNKCPSCQMERIYTGDSFESVFEWKCELAEYQRIALYDLGDSLPAISKWCPLRDESSK